MTAAPAAADRIGFDGLRDWFGYSHTYFRDKKLPELMRDHGFPPPLPGTRTWYRPAVDAWCARASGLAGGGSENGAAGVAAGPEDGPEDGGAAIDARLDALEGARA